MPRLQIALPLAFSSLFACSSDDTTTGTPTPDAGGPSSGVDFTIFVVDMQVDGSTYAPIGGASAFLDTAAGTRIEASSDDSGRVVFHGVSFDEGPASVTAYKSGRVALSIVGITPELVAKLPYPIPQFPAAEKNLTFGLDPVTPPTHDTVKMTGTISGKLAAENLVTFSTSPAYNLIFQSAETTYSLDVPKGQPLKLLAMEWTKTTATSTAWDETKQRWLAYDVPAQNADGVFDLDLTKGTAITPTKVSVTLKTPDASKLGAAPGWQINSLTPASAWFTGSRSKVAATPGDANTFTADGEYVTVDAPLETPFTLAYFPGFDGEAAFVQHLGVPADGEVIEALAYPPAPTGVAVGAEIALPPVDASVESAIVEVVAHKVVGGTGVDTPAWRVQVIRGAPLASMKLPDLPDAARALLPDSPSARLLVAGGTVDPSRPFTPGKIAASKFFKVTK